MLNLRRIASSQSLRVLSTRTAASLPPNEPSLSFDVDSPHREKLMEVVKRLEGETVEIPCVVGGEEVYTGNIKYQLAPHNHSLKVAKVHFATPEVIKKGIEKALAVRKEWEKMPYEDRAAIFVKAADLLSGPYKYEGLATTMVGQGKTAQQALIDTHQELPDFWRFGAHFGRELHKGIKLHQPRNTMNRMIYRGLEGFIAAVSPFNFTAIGGNLCGTPALMGNVVLWKPATTASLSNYLVFKLFKEAGLPDGVINFIPSSGPVFGENTITSPHLAAINFTGSVPTFNHLWQQVGQNINNYRTYPRLIGETGGKNYHFLHPTGHVESFVNGTIRASFEYQGQKCSASSRVYVPQSLWPQVKESLVEQQKEIKVGSVADYDTFVTGVIDDKSFATIKKYIEHAKQDSNYTIIAGGNCDDSVGYFIDPTVIESKDPKSKLMSEEIFGPVVTAYVYPDNKVWETLELLEETSPFGLTGSIFARERTFIKKASDFLKDTCGNFYINDKSTGSVVAQQPFGGARMSGTNDKAGSGGYVARWVSPQSIKETTVPLDDWRYSHMTN